MKKIKSWCFYSVTTILGILLFIDIFHHLSDNSKIFSPITIFITWGCGTLGCLPFISFILALPLAEIINKIITFLFNKKLKKYTNYKPIKEKTAVYLLNITTFAFLFFILWTWPYFYVQILMDRFTNYWPSIFFIAYFFIIFSLAIIQKRFFEHD